ncbi:MAG: hypothetical protein GWP70_10010 [Proteobacteria bacterium]|nr:hypothetical protein [Pseudomonadota bacterium]
MRADKAKVIDEIWDDARIDSFLDKQPLGDEPADYSQLLHAYRSMRLEDFEKFLRRYRARGGNPAAPNKDGIALADVIKDQRQAGPFLALLNS